MDMTGRTCAADFRLHAMDLEPSPPLNEQQRHWMLNEPPLRSWIATLTRDYRKLRATGAGPFAGRRLTASAVIEQLGFAQRPAPTNMLEQLRFTGAMFMAASRLSVAIHGELATRGRTARR